MTNYLVSSITEIPGSCSRWEMVTREGRTMLLTYEVGELVLCEWDPSADAAQPGHHWRLVCARRREGLTILERIKENRIPLPDALEMLSDVVAVGSYVASYELTGNS